MQYHFCVICWAPVIHPQQTTCGANECRDAWRFLGRDARLKHHNLATMSPSERALCLSQGPSPDEVAERAEKRASLEAALETAQTENTKGPSDLFRRSFLDPINAPIKHDEDSNDTK